MCYVITTTVFSYLPLALPSLLSVQSCLSSSCVAVLMDSPQPETHWPSGSDWELQLPSFSVPPCFCSYLVFGLSACCVQNRKVFFLWLCLPRRTSSFQSVFLWFFCL